MVDEVWGVPRNPVHPPMQVGSRQMTNWSVQLTEGQLLDEKLEHGTAVEEALHAAEQELQQAKHR